MQKKYWSVTFAIVTEESAEHGDYAESGYACKNVTLREAIAELYDFSPFTDPIDYIECNCYPVSVDHPPKWVSVYAGPNLHNGDREHRSIHVPDHITPASRVRLARLLGAA